MIIGNLIKHEIFLVTTITKIRPRRSTLKAVKITPPDQDMLVIILESALRCAKNAQIKQRAADNARRVHRETHLRNCRDAITRAGFYISDQLDAIE